MTQKSKALLLVDLSARLPFGTICQMEDKLMIDDSHFYDYTLSERHIELFRNHKGFYIRPYLRPMSSMSEEEREEFNIAGGVMSYNPQNDTWAISAFTPKAYDWLNANHFDYRGLIPKSLAIKVTKENNPYKE